MDMVHYVGAIISLAWKLVSISWTCPVKGFCREDAEVT